MITIKCTDDPDVPEKTREEVRPGNPYIAFSTKPSVTVVIDNPIQRSGQFRITTGICDGDTTDAFTEKVAKNIGLKGTFFLFIYLTHTIFVSSFRV